MNLNPIGVLQIAGYMIQVGVYEAFGDAEYPQAFYKVLFPPGGNNDLIQHIFIADIFQTFQRVMYGEGYSPWNCRPGSCFSIPDCGGCV